jgi:ribosomal protein L24
MAARQLKNWVRKSALRTIPKPIEPLGRWRVVTGDTVIVVSGEDSGKTGKIKAVLRTRNRVLVEGVNLVRKAVRPVEGVAGGIISVEAPIHVSNVNLVDPSTGYVVCLSLGVNRRSGRAPEETTDTHTIHSLQKTHQSRDSIYRRWSQSQNSKKDWYHYPNARPRFYACTSTCGARYIRDPCSDTEDFSFCNAFIPHAGARDTPAAEASKQTYFPPADLIPFLVGAKAADNAQSIFRARRTGKAHAFHVLHACVSLAEVLLMCVDTYRR